MENYIVWCEDFGHEEKDGGKVSAYDAESAAREWAGAHDRRTADYDIANGGGTILTVKEIATGVIEQYSVSAEAVPHYYASKVPNAELTRLPACGQSGEPKANES